MKIYAFLTNSIFLSIGIHFIKIKKRTKNIQVIPMY